MTTTDELTDELTNEPAVSDEQLVGLFRGRRVDHDTKAIYRGWLQHRLLINRCVDCGVFHEPPFPVCPTCWSNNVMPTEVSGKGTIFMFVLLHQGPPAPGVDYSTPHPVIVVELDEQAGLRISSTLIGATNDEIRIGRRVTLGWIDRGGAPMPVFRLAERAPHEEGAPQ